MGEQLLVVNSDDEVIGIESRERCHAGDGILHRAITTFIFNARGQLLLAQRSALKALWPEFWDASCSTHVYEGETYEQSGERRLPVELGFSCKLKFFFKFQYQVRFGDSGSENEMCALLVGHYDEEIAPNPLEVKSIQWVSLEELAKEIDDGKVYAPWFQIAFKKYLENKK